MSVPLYRRVRSSGLNYVRGLNPAAHFRRGIGITVTGAGVSQWDDQSGNARHLKQGTDANRPIALLHTGTNYLYLPGVAGNYASTPDPTSFPTGDIDIVIRMSMPDWTPVPAASAVFGKYGAAGQRSALVEINSAGTLKFTTSADGTAVVTATSSAAPTVSDGQTIWIRVTRNSTSGDVNFYTSADSSSVPSSWTQLGTTQSTSAGGIFDSTATICVGMRSDGSTGPIAENIYRALVYSTIGGTTPVVDFNAADATDQAATFASSTTGETWTVNTSGAKPAQIVGRSSILFDGSAHFLKCDAFTLNQPETVYLLFRQVSWTANDFIFDGTAASMQAYQDTASPKISTFAGTTVIGSTALAVGSYGVLATVFNGASSVIAVNNGAPITGDCGVQNAGGFTLGATRTPSAYSNIQVLEAIIYPTAHDATQRARVIKYLAGVGGVAL